MNPQKEQAGEQTTPEIVANVPLLLATATQTSDAVISERLFNRFQRLIYRYLQHHVDPSSLDAKVTHTFLEIERLLKTKSVSTHQELSSLVRIVLLRKVGTYVSSGQDENITTTADNAYPFSHFEQQRKAWSRIWQALHSTSIAAETLIEDPIVKVFMAVAAAFERPDVGRIWLATPSPALDNKPPLALVATAKGRDRVLNELGLIEHGML